MKADAVAKQYPPGHPELRFYMNTLYQSVYNYYMAGQVNLRITLKKMGYRNLLLPVEEILNRPMDTKTFEYLLNRFRSRTLVHQSFHPDVIQREINAYWDMNDPQKAELFQKNLNDLFFQTQILYRNLASDFPHEAQYVQAGIDAKTATWFTPVIENEMELRRGVEQWHGLSHTVSLVFTLVIIHFVTVSLALLFTVLLDFFISVIKFYRVSEHNWFYQTIGNGFVFFWGTCGTAIYFSMHREYWTAGYVVAMWGFLAGILPGQHLVDSLVLKITGHHPKYFGQMRLRVK